MITAEVALLILKVLGFAIAAMKLTPDLRRRKEAYIAQIEVMVKEGRGPTEEELAALMSESDDLTLAIRAQRTARG
jgi:hypothetical protein